MIVTACCSHASFSCYVLHHVFFVGNRQAQKRIPNRSSAVNWMSTTVYTHTSSHTNPSQKQITVPMRFSLFISGYIARAGDSLFRFYILFLLGFMSGLAGGEGSRFMNAKNADATIGGIRVLQKLMSVNATVPCRLQPVRGSMGVFDVNFETCWDILIQNKIIWYDTGKVEWLSGDYARKQGNRLSNLWTSNELCLLRSCSVFARSFCNFVRSEKSPSKLRQFIGATSTWGPRSWVCPSMIRRRVSSLWKSSKCPGWIINNRELQHGPQRVIQQFLETHEE